MKSKRCLIIQHDELGRPGRVAAALQALGWETLIRHPYRGDDLPAAPPDDCAAMVSLGGAMSAWEDEAYPFLAVEKRLLRAAIESDFPTLGICLGAQLLAATAGARVYRGLKPEIGWTPVALTGKGITDPLLEQAGMPPQFLPFQWHNDTFDLPLAAVHLAKSALYTRQAFRLGANVYALQFHPEVDADLYTLWRPRLPEALRAQEAAEQLQNAGAWADRLFRSFFIHATRL